MVEAAENKKEDTFAISNLFRYDKAFKEKVKRNFEEIIDANLTKPLIISILGPMMNKVKFSLLCAKKN